MFGFAALDPGDPAPLDPTRRDALFCLGVLALQAEGDPASAAALLARVRRDEQMAVEPGQPPSGLFWAALRGELHATQHLDGGSAAAVLHRRILDEVHAAGAAIDAAPDDLRLNKAADDPGAEPSLLHCEGLP
jgi:hypothetical protein